MNSRMILSFARMVVFLLLLSLAHPTASDEPPSCDDCKEHVGNALRDENCEKTCRTTTKEANLFPLKWKCGELCPLAKSLEGGVDAACAQTGFCALSALQEQDDGTPPVPPVTGAPPPVTGNATGNATDTTGNATDSTDNAINVPFGNCNQCMEVVEAALGQEQCVVACRDDARSRGLVDVRKSCDRLCQAGSRFGKRQACERQQLCEDRSQARNTSSELCVGCLAIMDSARVKEDDCLSSCRSRAASLGLPPVRLKCYKMCPVAARDTSMNACIRENICTEDDKPEEEEGGDAPANQGGNGGGNQDPATCSQCLNIMHPAKSAASCVFSCKVEAERLGLEEFKMACHRLCVLSKDRSVQHACAKRKYCESAATCEQCVNIMEPALVDGDQDDCVSSCKAETRGLGLLNMKPACNRLCLVGQQVRARQACVLHRFCSASNSANNSPGATSRDDDPAAREQAKNIECDHCLTVMETAERSERCRNTCIKRAKGIGNIFLKRQCRRLCPIVQEENESVLAACQRRDYCVLPPAALSTPTCSDCLSMIDEAVKQQADDGGCEDECVRQAQARGYTNFRLKCMRLCPLAKLGDARSACQRKKYCLG